VTPELQELIEAAHDLAVLIEAPRKKSRQYYYDEVEQKRWILGDGGRSGNCEICVDNSDRGWIDMDDTYESVFGDVDEAPAHPNCTCEVEFKTRRKRVYV